MAIDLCLLLGACYLVFVSSSLFEYQIINVLCNLKVGKVARAFLFVDSDLMKLLGKLRRLLLQQRHLNAAAPRHVYGLKLSFREFNESLNVENFLDKMYIDLEKKKNEGYMHLVKMFE